MALDMAGKTFPERVRVRTFSAFEWLLGHRRSLTAAAVGLVLGAGALGLWWWRAQQREGVAGKALAEVNQAFRQQHPAGFYLPGGEGTEAKPEALMQRYQEVAEQYRGTRAAAEALLRAAHLEYSAGLYDAAIRDYDRYVGRRRAPFRATAILGKGYALQAKGDLSQAAAAFGLAAEAAGRDPVGAEAYLAQGRALEGLQKREEARRAYGLVAEHFPQSGWAVRAAERLAGLQ